MSQPGVPPYPGGQPPQGYPGYPGHPPYAPRPQPQPHYRPQPTPEVRRDVEAAWQARLELGMDFEQHIAAGLAERVEELAQQRTQELRHQADAALRTQKSEDAGRGRQLALGIVSVVMGVPITGIAGPGMDAGVLPIIISWTGLVGVNVAHALSLRRSQRRDR